MNANKRYFAALMTLSTSCMATTLTQAETVSGTPQTTNSTLQGMAIDPATLQPTQHPDPFQTEFNQLLNDCISTDKESSLAIDTNKQSHFNVPIESKLKRIHELLSVLEYEPDTFHRAEPQLAQLDKFTVKESLLTRVNNGTSNLTTSHAITSMQAKPVVSYTRQTKDARLLVMALRG